MYLNDRSYRELHFRGTCIVPLLSSWRMADPIPDPEWNHYYTCTGPCLAPLFATYFLFMCHPEFGGDFMFGSCRQHFIAYYLLMILTVPLAILGFCYGLLLDLMLYICWVITGGCFGCCCPPVISTDVEAAVPAEPTFCRRFGREWTTRCFNFNTEGSRISGHSLIGILLGALFRCLCPSCLFLKPRNYVDDPYTGVYTVVPDQYGSVEK